MKFEFYFMPRNNKSTIFSFYLTTNIIFINLLGNMLKGKYQLLKGYENNHVTIGFGSYGQVKLARNLETGQIVAVKIINKLAKNEIIFHNKLSHPKIIQLLNHQIDKERQITYMVLEYADDGTLFEKIKTSPLTKSQVKKYFRDVCEAISYLHSKQIMHRDIKPQNVLLTKKGEAKLCDFGFAAILGERKTLCGTYEYMSPQMIQNRAYDYKIDIWALGILLFQMIAGQAPFRGESPEQVLNQMKTKIFFCERFENQEINLIKMILRVTPHKRPTVQQILDNSFFNDDSKTSKSSETETSHIQKLASVSSKSNLQPCTLNNKVQTGPFVKKLQKTQNSKQPQNSFPFYVPKNKYHTGGSTGSTGNSGSVTSTNIIMPEHLPTKNDQLIKNQIISPKKRVQDISSAGETYKQNISKIPSQVYHGCTQNIGSMKSFKGLNFSMGSDFRDKFNAMHGEQIQTINQQSQMQKKSLLQFPNTNQNKTFFAPMHKTPSNRFS